MFAQDNWAALSKLVLCTKPSLWFWSFWVGRLSDHCWRGKVKKKWLTQSRLTETHSRKCSGVILKEKGFIAVNFWQASHILWTLKNPFVFSSDPLRAGSLCVHGCVDRNNNTWGSRRNNLTRPILTLFCCLLILNPVLLLQPLLPSHIGKWLSK